MKKRILLICCASLLLLVAVGVTIYPLVSNRVNEKYQSLVCTEYDEAVAEEDDKKIQDAKEEALEYNQALLPVQYHTDALQAAQVDYHTLLNIGGNNIMGYVEIPKIDLYQPIYHGTGTEILDDGIGHLIGSSLPIGGDGTHAVLTGHSGVAGKRLFSDIDQLTQGDVFYIHVLDDVLAYEVTETHTVLPYDTTFLTIEDGKDRCTLITCVPFGINTHRLLVQGDRIPYEEAEQIREVTAKITAPSTWQRQYYRGLLMGVVMALGGGAGIFYLMRKRRTHHAKK